MWEKLVNLRRELGPTSWNFDSSSADSDCTGLMVNHMMSASTSSLMNDCIVDSGATGHMCNHGKLFVELRGSDRARNCCVGDGIGKWQN